MIGVGLIDYGMGNRRSVEKALEHVGARVRVSRDHDELRRCDGLVLPGVGAFPLAMRRLGTSGWRICCVRRWSGGSRCSGSAWACSCCSNARRSSSRRTGSA